MKQDEIIEMARQAGFEGITSHEWVGYTNSLEALAKLVDAKATTKEREACAKVCESLNLYGSSESRQLQRATMKDCAYAIRARGEA
jgi:hypothetical protein